MSYSLSSIPKFNDLMFSRENRKEVAKSLNLKYNIWKDRNNGSNYHILKYNKEWMCVDSLRTIGLLRSVILDDDDNSIVCFAPPKSLISDNLTIENGKTYTAEAFIEGTMINMFYDKKGKCFQIATRSCVGGDMCFYMENGFNKDITFRKMFDEVCMSIGFDYKNNESLNKDYIYSFVMQHPNNRIVKSISEMKLYLTDVFQIVEYTTVKIIDFRKMNLLEGVCDKIKTPNQSVITSNEALQQCKETCASMNTSYHIQGVVIKTDDGARYKFRNPNYEHVRHLRGNQPKLQYQYLVLRQSGKVKEYLQYYPEHKKPFEEFRSAMHDYTNQLFNNYKRCYVKKEAELKTFPDKYKTHMYVLHHEVFLKELRPENKYITKEVVINYINKVHPAKIMFVMNYDLRKKFVEENRINTDVQEDQ
jgi:hypothetical protein